VVGTPLAARDPNTPLASTARSSGKKKRPADEAGPHSEKRKSQKRLRMDEENMEDDSPAKSRPKKRATIVDTDSD
jgi:hypothetical protein